MVECLAKSPFLRYLGGIGGFDSVCGFLDELVKKSLFLSVFALGGQLIEAWRNPVYTPKLAVFRWLLIALPAKINARCRGYEPVAEVPDLEQGV